MILSVEQMRNSHFDILFLYVVQELARGLQDLLEYEGDVEEDFGLTFMVCSVKLPLWPSG